MTDRYRSYAPPGRAATYNPARSSVPTSIGYSSLHAGDMHILPSPARHHTTTPRVSATSTSAAGVPTTTRTYAVTSDPRSRPSTHEHGRSRRSTLDSSSRAPVIVTTTQKNPASSHSSNRLPSPARDEYRLNDSYLYPNAGSSSRSRSHNRSFSGTHDSLSHRGTDSTLSSRDAEAYRSTRPTVVYPSDPRHSHAGLDYGTDGYQYTNAGELAKYDLEKSHPTKTRHRDSFDRGYHRPNVNYNTDQRSLDVTTSPDLSRNYNMNTSRPYEGGRGGPPPSTRGFDRILRDPMPSTVVPPNPRSSLRSDATPAPEAREGRRPRPTSMYLENVARSSHHDDYYKSRDEERTMRELRDREREPDRSQDSRQFRDDAIGSRGFGIRAGVVNGSDGARDSRRESRRNEPKRRSDEDVRTSDLERDDPRRLRPDERGDYRPRRDSRRGSDEDERERARLRDNVAASGLGIAGVGAAAGLASAVGRRDESREREDPLLRRRRSPDEDENRRTYAEESGASSLVRTDPDHWSRDDDERTRAIDQHRREAAARLSGDAVASGSDSDETRHRSRRNGPAQAGFDPNDPNDLRQLKEQLANMNSGDSTKAKGKETARVKESDRTRSSSPQDLAAAAEPSGALVSRDRSTSVSPGEGRQVRLVSPHREKNGDKPLRGILKQPKVSFPEDNNPVREGVAPHKDDKKAKEAPAGARWTRVSRKVVNPEALTIGKERFEVRDDFVIVLRVLSREEIEAYAAATQVLRERRKTGEGRSNDEDRDHKDDDGSDDRDRGRRRRHRGDDDDEAEPRPKEMEAHRSHREGEREERDKDRDRDRTRVR